MTSPRKPRPPRARLMRDMLVFLGKPRESFQQVKKRRDRLTLLILSAAMGVVWILQQLFSASAGAVLTGPAILAASIVGGPVAGFCLVYALGVFLYWVGSALGGLGKHFDLRLAFCWAWIPNILTLPIWVGALTVFGAKAFVLTPTAPYQSAPHLLAMALLAVQLIAGTWCLVLLVVTTSEAHQFSVWRSILTLTITGTLLFLGLYLIIGITMALG